METPRIPATKRIPFRAIRWLPVVLMLLGAGCAIPGLPRGSAGPKGAVTCDYLGQSYPQGASRSADDGCNVCACSETGWTCSRFKCPAAARDTGGLVRGRVSGPVPGELPSLRVCAEGVLPNSQHCVNAAGASYELRLPLGRWWVYATEPGGRTAWWTEAVKCGLGSECVDHSLLAVNIAQDGDIAVADPLDWGIMSSVKSFSLVPSKRLDLIFYYPDAVFEARTTGAESVEVLYQPFPSAATAPFKSLGYAVLQKTEQDVQVWTLPVPKDLEAQDATVKITEKNGAVMRWRGIGWIRSEATLHADDQNR